MCFFILHRARVERGRTFGLKLSSVESLKSLEYCVRISSKRDKQGGSCDIYNKIEYNFRVKRSPRKTAIVYRRQFYHLQIGGKNFKIPRVVLEIMGFEEHLAGNDIKGILVQNLTQ